MKQPRRSHTLADMIKSQEFENWITRPVARAAKTTAKGLASLGDLANLPVNAARGFMGKQPLQSPSELVGEAFDEYTGGLTKPQNPWERGIDTAGEFITSGGPFAAAAKAAPIAGKLAAQTPTELLGAGGAGGAFQAGREIFPESTIAPIAASILPGAAMSSKGALGKVLGVDANKAKVFEQAKLTPTLADISNSRFIKGIQNTLAESPGSGKIIGDAIQSTNDKIAKLEQHIPQEIGGNIAQEGLKTYITKANKLTEKLKQSWANDITPAEKMQINKTSEVFSQKPTIYEPENIKAYENSTIGKLQHKLAVIANRNEGKIPLGDAMFIRNEIDDLISTFGMVGDKTQGELKSLRGSLSDDIRSFAYSKGEKTGRNFDRYNKFYNQYRTKLDRRIQPLLKNKTATEAFNSIKNDLRVDAKKANTVLDTLKPEQKEIFSQSLIRELGMNPQNEFNGANLATNFKKLEPKAQEVVLSGLPEKARSEFRATIEAIDYMKGTKAQSNPSGTFNQAFKLGVLGALITKPIPTISTLGAAYGASKLMTQPKFLNWLAKADNIQNPKQAVRHIHGLAIMAKDNPELAPVIKGYLDNLSKVEDQEDIDYDSMSRDELRTLMEKEQQIAPDYDSMPQEELRRLMEAEQQ